MDKESRLGISKRYNLELQDIANKLNDLEHGRIYEFTDARMDGSLATNAQQLKTMIRNLLSKIDNQSPSAEDELSSLFGSESSEEI